MFYSLLSIYIRNAYVDFGKSGYKTFLATQCRRKQIVTGVAGMTNVDFFRAKPECEGRRPELLKGVGGYPPREIFDFSYVIWCDLVHFKNTYTS